MALTDRPQKVGPPPESKGQGPLTPAPRPYNWRATAWLILGIVVVAGAMGVFMRVIPTPFTQPAPTSVPTARPTAQPAGAPAPATFAPTTAPLAAPTLAPSDSARNQPTVAPAVQPTIAVQPTGAPTTAPRAAPQPTTAPAVVTTTQPTAAPTPVEQPTTGAVDPALEAEILDAYSNYWHVRDDALATLDGSHLDEAMYGEELLAAEAYLDQLRSQGRAGVGPEDHSITLVSATSEEAVIYDRVIDKGIFIDPETREPLPPEQQAANPETEVAGYYYLRKIDGVWKVVREG